MENQTPQKLTKKAARLQVKQALYTLADLEKTLGKKKFRRRMEKVERILSEGLPKAPKPKKLKAQPAA
jgi:hypothetical protein